jgi:hypothetical protein
MLARQIILPRPLPTNLTPFLRYSYSLLPLFLRVPSFVFNSLQPLLPKTGGWGIPRASHLRHYTRPSSIFYSFVFTVLRVAFPATPFLSQTSALGGVFLYPERSTTRGFSNIECRTPKSGICSALLCVLCVSALSFFFRFFRAAQILRHSDLSPVFS